MNEIRQPTKIGDQTRYVFLDALRGIAALWVVLFHAFEGGHLAQLQRYMPGPVEWFFANGDCGVPIFFVISGFVIAHSLRNERVTFSFMGRFVLRRSLRLDPPYWTTIILIIGLAIASRALLPERKAELPSWSTLLAHLFYLQGLLGCPQINIVFWTLCIEIQFYVVFCACLGLAQAFRTDDADNRSLLWIFGSAAVVSLLWPYRVGGSINGLFLPFWHGFLVGVFANWAVLGKIPWWIFYLYIIVLMVAAGIYPNTFLATCLIVAVLLAEVGRAGRLRMWLNWRWLQFLGLISYSLYLIHNPITGAAYNVGYRLTGRNLFTEALWFVLVLLINVGIAAGFWYLIERSSIRLSQRFKNSHGPERPSGPTPSLPTPSLKAASAETVQTR